MLMFPRSSPHYCENLFTLIFLISLENKFSPASMMKCDDEVLENEHTNSQVRRVELSIFSNHIHMFDDTVSY